MADEAKPGDTAGFVLAGALLAGLAVYSVTRPIVLYPDSQTYIDGSIIRAPLYPLFIATIRYMAGSAFLDWVARGQCLIGLIASVCCAHAARKCLGAGGMVFGALACMFYLPFAFNGSTILSEPLAYSMYLLFLAALCGYASSKGLSWIAVICLSCFLCVMVRPQMSFVFVVGFLFVVFNNHNAVRIRHAAIVIFFFVAASFAASVARNTYNFIINDYYGSVSTVGEHVLANMLYVVDVERKHAVGGAVEQEFLGKSLERIQEKRLSINHEDNPAGYAIKSNVIYYNVIYPVYKEMFGEDGSAARLYVERDAFCMRLGWELFKRNYAEYAKMLVYKLWSSQFLYVFTIILVSVFSIVVFLVNRDVGLLLLVAVSCATILNYASIIPFTAVSPRYTYVTDIPQFVALIACGVMVVSKLIEKLPRA